MQLVDGNDPILKQPCEKYNFINPQTDLVELVDNMVRVMYDNYGLGISANQIGVPLQIFVMAAEKPVLVINPKILESSPELVELEEGCVSYPKHFLKIKRPMWVKVRYNLGSGQAQTFRYEGISARVFQHQYDLLNGKTMWDNVSKLKRDMLLKKMEKMK